MNKPMATPGRAFRIKLIVMRALAHRGIQAKRVYLPAPFGHWMVERDGRAIRLTDALDMEILE
jgi:hypothetical protein